MSGRRAIAALAAPALLAGLGACATPKSSYVIRAETRGSYIDATLSVSDGDWRFLFPASEPCRRVLRVEAPVEYVDHALWGRVVSPAGETCDAVGIGTLRRWRRPRVEGEMAPSAPASWDVIHRDASAYLLRGRFPLATRVGLANTYDVVALVPNDQTCAPVAESGNATLTYHQSGSRVLMLGPCPVQAVAPPL